ncbi:MAG: peptidase C11, partial [Acetatifactor sp.]|nr:peptidase C11 [Acetatifactor sp.]
MREARASRGLVVVYDRQDLESRNGMGTADIQEMLNARFGSNINLLIYTGGCKTWKNNMISSSSNQIWQVKDGTLINLQKDLGSVSMTEPGTLSGYVKWCAENYPASRYELILWDHGGGSVRGYGYDEKFASSGSMSLAGLDSALRDAGVKFDFIGFDACLMATVETALTMSQYADYLIASEETEPGAGWYYTDWLTALGENTSMPTIQVGQNIADSFVDTCARRCQGQLTTLSVTDLAELEHTLPQALAQFSNSTAELIRDQQYQTVSNARNGAREFAQSSKIDQIDLVHLAQNLDTQEGNALTEALLGAVKYNRTSSNMTNAYGLSIYFPYRKTSTVNRAVSTFEEIGMDEAYTRCIRQF